MNNWQKGAKKAWVTRKKNGTDVAWNKGLKVPQQTGEKHALWKGTEVSYSALHHWISRHKGKALNCSECGLKEGKFEWANVDGKYKRVLEDYVSMCKPCHRKYDKRDYSFLGENMKKNPKFFNRWIGEWQLKTVV